jgi:hypothetical protein
MQSSAAGDTIGLVPPLGAQRAVSFPFPRIAARQTPLVRRAGVLRVASF